jgi:hypothetical protein
MRLHEPYRKRPIRFLELCAAGDWRLKVYGIIYQGAEFPRPALVEQAKTLLLPHLPPVDDRCYGVGFIGAHQGRGADFVFLGWWADENELFLHVYAANYSAPEEWLYLNTSGPLACVWDLAVVAHERDAWVRHVLMNPGGPDLDAYLAQHFNADV